MKQQLFVGGFVISSLLALTSNVQAMTMIIDDFTVAPDPPILSILGDDKNPKRNKTEGNERSIIGGERELKFENIESDSSVVLGFVAIDKGNERLSISNPPGYTSKTTVTWDGTDQNPLNSDLAPDETKFQTMFI
ncbi:hypothetical protein, partial [Crocosphaera sp. Alani8]|uniref:hypothetical protein n=1 Tax=Crocosphaera sp. Alani8 TaxID=3038952 RepID=UPI00313A878E